MVSDLAVLILAAGAGERFGGIKPLAEVDGRPMILNACALADQGVAGPVHVVLGAHHQRIAERLPANVQVVLNPSWQQGMGSSLAAGMTALGEAWNGVLVLLADQVALRPEALAVLAERWRQAPGHVVSAHYGGRPGVPAIFPRRLFAELAGFSGGQGAKEILVRETGPETWLPMPEAAVDIDTPADLETWSGR